ncbi:MAG: hypothetical protein AB1457_16185 [Chloroflexota bacterium]
MTSADAKRFGEIFATLAEVFGKQVSAAVTRVYFEVLREYSIEEFEVAAKAALSACRYFPKPVELVELMPYRKQWTDPKAMAVTQAAEVMQQIRVIGFYGTPRFADEITDRLIKTRWRWGSLCSKTEDELSWWARDFVDAYLAECKVANERQGLPWNMEGGRRQKNLTWRSDVANGEPSVIGVCNRIGRDI